MAVLTRRPRRQRSQGGEAAVTELKAKVDMLLKENRRLKRELIKVEEDGGAVATRGRRANPIAVGLASINRKLTRALSAPASTNSRLSRRSASIVTTRTRRPASPETREKRLQALARAREVRAGRKAEAAAG